MNKTDPGFTLVEFIVVVTILSVLAVTAWLRLTDFTPEVHHGNVADTSGALSTAVQLVQIRYMLNGLTGPQDNLAGYGSGTVDTNANGFPTDTRNRNAIGGSARRCMRVWNAVLSPAPTIQVSAAGTADYRARATGQTCRYLYRRDTKISRVIFYDSLTGAVTTNNP
jgi:prepilin-type N-terminal cleavage/methylation domain-containing protein